MLGERLLPAFHWYRLGREGNLDVLLQIICWDSIFGRPDADRQKLGYRMKNAGFWYANTINASSAIYELMMQSSPQGSHFDLPAAVRSQISFSETFSRAQAGSIFLQTHLPNNKEAVTQTHQQIMSTRTNEQTANHPTNQTNT